MFKKVLLPVLLLAMLFAVCGCGVATTDADETTITITDLTGRVVTVPKNAQRIAAVTGPSYEMVFLLGQQDRLVMVKSGQTKNYPVALLTNPDLANYTGVSANPSSTVNIEEYLSQEIDLVIYYDNNLELKKFEAVDIPAVVVTLNTGIMDTAEQAMGQTIDDFVENSTSAVRILSTILGPEAVSKYERWYDYCNEKLRMLYERTHALPDEQRKTLYWGNTWGENLLSSYALKNRGYEIWLCGGNLVGPVAGNGNFPEVTSEQLFTWDPDIILVDNHGNYPELVIKDMFKENSRWAPLSAVKNNEVYRIPAGVFFLDKGTTTTLMMLWLATVIQPELFEDINVIEEIKYYYSEFYEFELTDEQAENIISGWYDKVGSGSDE